jgi:hypothetical protein
MSMNTAVDALLLIIAAYTLLGLVFAVAFVPFGARRLDAGAAGAGPVFAALIVPGSVALWPLLLVRWWRASHGARS